MLPRYALIGRSLPLLGGRITVLGGFLFLLSLLGGAVFFTVLSGEWARMREMGVGAKAGLTLLGSWGLTRLLGFLLFRPLPASFFPTGAAKQVDEGLATAIKAGLAWRELDGFARGSVFDPSPIGLKRGRHEP